MKLAEFHEIPPLFLIRFHKLRMHLILSEREVMFMDERQNINTENEPDHEKNIDTQDMMATNLNGHRPNKVETNSTRDEEFAAEITADDVNTSGDMEKDDGDVISAYGWIGIALSVISFFVMPIILGGAGIILGFVSRSKGADSLGNTAIAAGAISIVITLFVLPYV